MANVYKSKFNGTEIDAILELVQSKYEIIDALTMDSDKNLYYNGKKVILEENEIEPEVVNATE